MVRPAAVALLCVAVLAAPAAARKPKGVRAKKSSVDAKALAVKSCCEDASTAELIVAMRGGSDERTAADHALAARDGADKTMAVEIQEVLDLRGSDTACLLALGAEWCGPCKVLKPLLRKAAEASQGTLILKEIDVDKERPIAEALEATQLPCVYSVRDGKLRDVIVGLPRSHQDLAAFVMRAMDGEGGATTVPGSRTVNLARVAGSAALGAGGREALAAKCRGALDACKTLAASDKDKVMEALKTTKAYLERAYGGKPVYRDNAVFVEKVAPCAPALDLFAAAGYVEIPGDPEGEGDDQRDALHPTHRNLAVFELCCAEIDKARDDLRVQ